MKNKKATNVATEEIENDKANSQYQIVFLIGCFLILFFFIF